MNDVSPLPNIEKKSYLVVARHYCCFLFLRPIANWAKKERKKEKKKFKEFENGFWNNRSSIISLIGWCLVAWKHLHNLLRTKLWGSFSEGLVNNVYLVLWEYTIFLLWKKKNTWNQGTKYNWFDEFFLHASQMTVEFVKTTTSVHSRAN